MTVNTFLHRVSEISQQVIKSIETAGNNAHLWLPRFCRHLHVHNLRAETLYIREMLTQYNTRTRSCDFTEWTALHETPTQSDGPSLVILDHTVLPAT